MDGDPFVINVDDDTRDDRSGLHINGLEAFFKEFSEGFAHDDVPELRSELTPADFQTQSGLLS